MKTKIAITALALTALLLAARPLLPTTERADCPGTMICPQTGELICIDSCPLDVSEPATDQALEACEIIDTPDCCRAR